MRVQELIKFQKFVESSKRLTKLQFHKFYPKQSFGFDCPIQGNLKIKNLVYG